MRRKAGARGARRRWSIAATRWAGGLACAAGLAAWSHWFAWRLTSSPFGLVSAVVLVLEVSAFAVSVVLGIALWRAHVAPRPRPRASQLPDVYAELLGLDRLRSTGTHGADDTGEVGRARVALGLLDPRSTPEQPARSSPLRLAEVAWAFVAVEGIRRTCFTAVLVAVLLTGRVPFETPPWTVLSALVGAQVLFAVGHWLLSGRAVWPGARLRWSMASVGAGLGDGRSRTGLPIRWTATMATMVALNLAIALRGLSDRWTHGLGPMARDERVVAMLLSWWLELVGFAALRILVQPSLGFYGATRRLEEISTRRLALGTTVAVAMVGSVAGLLPGGLPA